MTRQEPAPDGLPHADGPLTEQSAPGTYLVVTDSGAVYSVDIVDQDAPAAVTRFPKDGALIKDGTALPGVDGFFFDTVTGRGEISWWKDRPADYDRPDLPYRGTTRTTSRVLLIVRVDADHGDTAPALLADLLRSALALEEHTAFSRFVDALLTTPPHPTEPHPREP